MEDLARQLCEGGADIIQLRAKEAEVEDISRMAKLVVPITRSAGVHLVINDHFSIAKETGAEGCHLGQEDFFDAGFTDVTELSGGTARPFIGLSTHSPEQASRAVEAKADYLGVGPVYATGTKPSAKPVTLEYVRWASRNIAIPWFAIGGINLENLNEVLEAGARRICVVSAILNASDVTATCRKFKQRLA